MKAFAPGNVSCIFEIKEHEDPAKMGSLGLGFTTDKGVIAEVSEDKVTSIIVNNEVWDFPTVKSVIDSLTKKTVKVDLKVDLPIGTGFGMSGACALSTALALNELLQLGKTREELVEIAHVAEVVNRTGLGDVAGQAHGGFLVKLEHEPSFEVKRLPIENVPIYYVVFDKLDTKSVITNDEMKKKINLAGSIALDKIKKMDNPTLKELIQLSKEFSIASGLLQDERVKSAINSVEDNGGNASMIMLGNAVFSDTDNGLEGCQVVRVSDKGACLL